MNDWLIVALGGALGAVTRHGVSSKFAALFPHFPVGTLVVNVAGSLLFGVLSVLIQESKDLSEPLRLALLTGFLGALTTFSTFSFETVVLIREGAMTHALINIGANVITCLLAVVVGMQLAHSLVR